jgi:hypothetical protein
MGKFEIAEQLATKLADKIATNPEAVSAVENYGTAQVAPKIAARMISPEFGLGKAFNDIAEPIQKVDAPVNGLIDRAGDKFSELTDLKRGATGQADENYRPIAKEAFKAFANLVTPTPSTIVAGKMLPMMRAVKPQQIAEAMTEAKSAAQLYLEAKGAKGSFGTVAVKPAPKINYGTVTVKEHALPSFGSVTVIP